MENKETTAFCRNCKRERRIINQKKVEKFITGLCEACETILVKKCKEKKTKN